MPQVQEIYRKEKERREDLDILNTWNGPGWTTASTLTMVLLSLQSILHEKPIQNEPGYENEDGEKSKNYNNFIAYHNIKRATINMITQM